MDKRVKGGGDKEGWRPEGTPLRKTKARWHSKGMPLRTAKQRWRPKGTPLRKEQRWLRKTKARWRPEGTPLRKANKKATPRDVAPGFSPASSGLLSREVTMCAPGSSDSSNPASGNRRANIPAGHTW